MARAAVTMADVQRFLRARGRAQAWEVGIRFWPHKDFAGNPDGGPSRCTTIALWMLGRMHNRGLVSKHVGAGPTWWYAKGEL